MNGYFDHNATTPLHPAAREAWLAASDQHWYNASSLYREAASTRHALEGVRERLAELLGIEDQPERIVFTSGATESNNALVQFMAREPDGHVLSSALEHPSLREPLKIAFSNRVSYLDTHADTTLDMKDFSDRLKRQRWKFVTVLAANNESGTLLPWQQLAEQCAELDIPFHCDASQWIGKLPLSGLGSCDYITGSAHKFGGPKGMGFLVMRDEEESLSFLRGGPQEEGRRAGTENYPAIAAMIAALEAVSDNTGSPTGRDGFEASLKKSFPDIRVIGAAAPRLWNTSMLVLPKHDNRKWLARLSDRGFAISTGSACSGGHDGSSVVLSALGASPDEMRRVIRVSGGWETTEDDWLKLAKAFLDVSADLEASPLQRQNRIL